MKKLVITLLVFTVINANAQEFSMRPKGTISELTVVVQNLFSDLIVQGDSAGDIKIETDDYQGMPEKAAGLRPLSALGPDNSGIGLNIAQSGNIVTISGTRRNTKNSDYRIMLPANIKLKIYYGSFDSDDITVRGMTNEVEVKSQVGDLKFVDVTGPIVASTISSDIEVKFSALGQSSPSSLSSVSGDIDITLPQSSKGNFKMSSISGEIYTNLDFKINVTNRPGSWGGSQWGFGKKSSTTYGPGTSQPSQPSQPSMPAAPAMPAMPAIPPVGMSVNATLNGGGVDVTIRSISGDIYIRKAK